MAFRVRSARAFARRFGSGGTIFVVVLLLSSPNALGFGAGPARATSAPSPLSPISPATEPRSAPAPSGPIPSVPGSFFTNNSQLAGIPSKYNVCGLYYGYAYCYLEAQNPSVVTLANGSIGVGFSVLSTYNTSLCPGTNATVSRIGFVLSADNGSTFGPIRYVGNTGPGSCPYFQGLEPSFATGARGEIFGAYVEANASATDLLGPYPGVPIVPYSTRTFDALAFVTSTNNGSSFSGSKLLVSGGNISRPVVAAFGRTVYIVYENISNGTTTLPGIFAYPISTRLLYSTDAGITWHGPYTLPGRGATEYYTTLGPAITVNSTGGVAVSYATNRHCVAYCSTYYSDYGYDIVVATSTTNGSSWKGPYTVGTNAGEANEYQGPYFSGSSLYAFSPETTLKFATVPTTVYVAWAAGYNLSAVDPTVNWKRSGIFSSASANGGSSWSPPRRITAPLNPIGPFQQQFGQGYFNPALGVAPSGLAYLSYSYFSWTNGGCGFTSFGNAVFAQEYAQYLSTSLDGTRWNQTSILYDSPPSAGIGIFSYMGNLGSVGFSTAGAPVIAYAVDSNFLSFSPPSNLSSSVTLSVSVPYQGPTATVYFAESGLAPGTPWQAEVGGGVVNLTAPKFAVPNVPAGRLEFVQWPGTPVPAGPGAILEPEMSEGPSFLAANGTTVFFNFTTFYGLRFYLQPPNFPYFSVSLDNYGSSNGYRFSYSWQTYASKFGSYYFAGGCLFPWYLPAHFAVSLTNVFNFPVAAYYYSTGAIDYWNGTGNGSFTGSGFFANLTMNGPINETMWMAGVGLYTVDVRAPSLAPAATFHFDLDGVSHSGAGGSSVYVANVSTGAHWLSGITANSSVAGWQYFGSSDVGNPVILPEEPVVNLSFAYVHVAAAAGTVHFHALGLVAGSVWRFSFNGTEYSSSTTWINVTTRPGTFPIHGYPVVSPNGTTGYVPNAYGTLGANATSLAVTPGSTYAVSFASAFRVDVLASPGGRVSPASGSVWVANGSGVSVTATSSSGFTFAGWTGTGPGAYTGLNASATLHVTGPIVETATFLPLPADRFNVTVRETGLPNGTLWSVFLNGRGYSTNGTSLVVPNLYSCASGALGRYVMFVPYVSANSSFTRYIPGTYPTIACGNTMVNVAFTTEYYLSLESTSGGTVSAVTRSGITSGSTWFLANSSITLSAVPNAGFDFLGWTGTGPGSYSGPAATQSILPTGPITEVASFAPTPPVVRPEYGLSLRAAIEGPTSNFAPGTAWSVEIGNSTYSSNSLYLNVSAIPSDVYPFAVPPALSPDSLTEYSYIGGLTTLNLSVNLSLNLTFTTSFWVALHAAGPGTVELIQPPSSVLPRPNGYFLAGHLALLRALPQGSNVFLAWSGTGSGSYSGTNPSPAVFINGSINETAAFGPPPAAPTVASSAWNSPAVWAGLAALGLAVGLAVGVLVARARRPGESTAPGTAEVGETTAPPESPPGSGT